MHALVKDYNLQRILICGDGQPDIVMEERAQQLVAANKFSSLYLSESKQKARLEIFKQSLEIRKNMSNNPNLTNKDRELIAKEYLPSYEGRYYTNFS